MVFSSEAPANVGFSGAVNPVAIEAGVPPPYGVSVGVDVVADGTNTPVPVRFTCS